MTSYSASKNFATSNGDSAAYRLLLSVTTSSVTGGTRADIVVTAQNLRNPGALAWDTSLPAGTKAYNTPNGRVNSPTGNLANSGSTGWTYDFRAGVGTTVAVWSFSRFYNTSVGSTASISLTVNGNTGSTSYLSSTTVSVTIDLITNVQVPSILNSTRTNANAAITGAGLVVRNVTSQNTTTQSLDQQVFSQTPSAGQIVSSGSAVDYSYYNYVAPTLYSITFNDDNPANSNPSSLSIASGSTFTLPSAGFKTGQYYQWRALIGGVYYYRNGGTTSPTVTSAQSWTAIWQNNSYTLTYNANGGTVSPSSKTVTYTSTYGTLPTPTRSGYSFNGWFTASSGGSQVSSSTVMGAGNVTIWARWTILTPGFTDETISQSLLINQDFSTVSDRQVSATNATSYSIQYAGTGPNPTSWLQIDSSGRLSGSTDVVGTYYFFINATGDGGTTPTGTKTITVSYPGERFLGEDATSGISHAKRFDGSTWLPVTHMQRFDGTTWKNITN